MPQPTTPNSHTPNPQVRDSLTPPQAQPLQVHSLRDCLGGQVSEVRPIRQVNLNEARAVHGQSRQPHVREQPRLGEVNGSKGGVPSEGE